MAERVCVPCSDLVAGDVMMFNDAPITIDKVTDCPCGEHIIFWFWLDNASGYIQKYPEDSAVMYRLNTNDRRHIANTMEQFQQIFEDL